MAEMPSLTVHRPRTRRTPDQGNRPQFSHGVWFVPLILATTISLVAGCGDGQAQVSGTVTLDGTPIAGGGDVRCTVSFFPEGGGTPAVGSVDQSGRYSLSTASRSELQPGSYNVAISAIQLTMPTEKGDSPSGRPMTPRHYARAAESGLHAEVKPGHNTFDFALESASSQ